MTNDFRQTTLKTKLGIPGRAYNRLMALADAQPSVGGGAGRPLWERQQTRIKVRNDSGDAVPRFGVLGLASELAIGPTENLAQFLSCPIFSGVTPQQPQHVADFCIVLQPLEAGAIGQAVIAGLVQTLLDQADRPDQFATAAEGVATHLVPAERGSARILWRAGGSGPQWAVVQLGVWRDYVAASGPLNEDLLAGGEATFGPEQRAVVDPELIPPGQKLAEGVQIAAVWRPDLADEEHPWGTWAVISARSCPVPQ